MTKKILTAQFEIEASDMVWQAVEEYRDGNYEFSDCLIGVVAKQYGSKVVGTFDKRASKSELFELIK
ncbi:MAG: PIN domain-containing protein [Gammaproteobacteria bacterium]